MQVFCAPWGDDRNDGKTLQTAKLSMSEAIRECNLSGGGIVNVFSGVPTWVGCTINGQRFAFYNVCGTVGPSIDPKVAEGPLAGLDALAHWVRSFETAFVIGETKLREPPTAKEMKAAFDELEQLLATEAADQTAPKQPDANHSA